MTFFLTVPTFSLTLVILSSVLLMSTGILGYHAKYIGYKYLYNPNLYMYISLFSIIFVITIFSTLSLFDLIFSSFVSLYTMGLNILELNILSMSDTNELPGDTSSSSSPNNSGTSSSSSGSNYFEKKNVNYGDITGVVAGVVAFGVTQDPLAAAAIGGAAKLAGDGIQAGMDYLHNRAIDHPSSVIVNRAPSPGLGETGGDRFFTMNESDYLEAPHVSGSQSTDPSSSITNTTVKSSEGNVVSVEPNSGKEEVNANNNNPYSSIRSINEEKSQLWNNINIIKNFT